MKTFKNILLVCFFIVIFGRDIVELFISEPENWTNENIEQGNTIEADVKPKITEFSPLELKEYQSINKFYDANIDKEINYFGKKIIVKCRGYLPGDYCIDRKQGIFRIYDNRGNFGIPEGEDIIVSYKNISDVRKYIVDNVFEENYVLVEGNVYNYTLNTFYIDAENIKFIPITISRRIENYIEN